MRRTNLRVKDLKELVINNSLEELTKKYKREYSLDEFRSIQIKYHKEDIYILDYLYYEDRDTYTAIIKKELYFREFNPLWVRLSNIHSYFEGIFIEL